MASTLVKIDIHLIFHVKSTGVKMRTEDLGRIFTYIGGIIKGIGGLPIEIGGMTDHVHILTSLPKTVSLADFVRAVKADSSKWMKQFDPCYAAFAWQVKNARNWTYATPDIYLSDMHDENVIRSNRTHTIFVVDCDIRINTPELRQGGTRTLTNAVEFV